MKNKGLLLTLIATVLMQCNAYNPLRPWEVAPTEKISPEEALKKIRKRSAKLVALTFVDTGEMKEIIIPIQEAEEALKYGVIIGDEDVENNDLGIIVVRPDLSSIFFEAHDPKSDKIARIMCDIDVDGGEPLKEDTRRVLKNMVNRLAGKGLELTIGSELEFFWLTSRNSHCQSLLPYEKKEPSMLGGHYKTSTSSKLSKMEHGMAEALAASEIPFKKFHHEGPCGQYEVAIAHTDALAAADRIMVAKHTISTVADRDETYASFMPKIFKGSICTGLHFNISIKSKKSDANIFYDSSTDDLSAMGRHFTAGILNRIASFSLLLNPTINSFRRLASPSRATRHICWGPQNRSALIRIPPMHPENKSNEMRIELRSPDMMCDPYLAIAAVLLMGLEGIKHHEELPEPVTRNLYMMDYDELLSHHLPKLPETLEKAIELFEQNELARQLLTDKQFERLIKAKKEEVAEYKKYIENNDITGEITEWELEKYL